MAQFDFFATWNDDWTLIQKLFSSIATSIVPDKWYRDRAPAVFKGLDQDFQSQLSQKRRAFLVPDGMRLNTDTGLVKQRSGPRAGWYRIEPPLLGEVLELTLPACFDDAGITCLGSGSLARAKEYFNHELCAWQPPSDSLIGFYKHVRQVLQANLISCSVGKSAVWMGVEAKQLMDAGQAKVVDRGL